MTSPAPAARVVNLTKTYGAGQARVVALDEVSVELYRGEFTAIMGPSGSGKSTLMHCAAALDTATSGSVFIGDTDLSQLKDKELTRLRRDQIGFVFQSFNLVPTLTAEENILLPLSIAGNKPDQEWYDTVIDTDTLLRMATFDISQLPYGNFAPGRFAWLFRNIRPVHPMSARGKPGLWPLHENQEISLIYV